MFSVVMPVYNVARFLPQCLDSVIKAGEALQKMNVGFELICVDDGSSDDSGVILDGYADRYACLRVIHQENRGVSVARNRAMEISRGEWISFMDSDDAVEENWFCQFKTMAEHYPDADIIMSNSLVVEEDGTEHVHHPGFEGTMSFSGDVLSRVNEGRLQRTMHVVWDKIYRRQMLERSGIRFVEGVPNGEDTFFVECCLSQAGRFVVGWDSTGYRYYMRGGSAIHRNSLKRACGHLSLAVAKIQHYKSTRSVAMRGRALSCALQLPFAGLGLSCEQLQEFKRILLVEVRYRQMVAPFVWRYANLKGRMIALLLSYGPFFLRSRILAVLYFIKKH